MAKRRGRPPLARLRNIDFTDRELLEICAECADDQGLINAADVAVVLGIEDPTGFRTPAGTVSGRMSWMRRYGFVDRIEPKTLGLRLKDGPRWIITPIGRELISGKLTAVLQRGLENASPGQELLIMRGLAQKGIVNADDSVSAAIRREYMHQVAKRQR